MSAARLKIVLPGGARFRFFSLSCVAHLVLLAVMIFMPQGSNARPAMSDEFANAINVELTGDISFNDPGPATSAPVQQNDPEPEPVEDEPEPQPQPIQPPPPKEDPTPAGDVKFSNNADSNVPEEDDDPTPIENDDLDAPTGDAPASSSGDASAQVQGGGGELSQIGGYFPRAVANALFTAWRRPPLAGAQEPISVIIRFQILRDGSAVGMEIVQSSGVRALDRSALRAVAEASPFPRIPPSWRSPRITAEYEFRLTPGEF